MQNNFSRRAGTFGTLMLVIAAGIAFTRCGAALGAPDVQITIPTAVRGQRENPHMWGVFLENICHDVDGGLYAQMIQNPDFKNDVPPADCKVVNGRWLSPDGKFHPIPFGGPLFAWKPVADPGDRASLHVTGRHPLSAAHKLSLQIHVQSGIAGVGNIGYGGMPLHAGRKYLITFYARTPGPTVPLHVELTNTLLSTPYGTGVIAIHGRSWNKYHCVLKCSGTTYQGLLALRAHAPARFNLTLVQMFPESRRTGKPEFFRRDIFRLLARLHPGFLRFPGGNFIEGISLDDSYNWRQTVGPMIDRPGHMNFWGYRNTDGFGFMGWLRLASRLKTQPMYCTSAGLLWNAQTIKGTNLNLYIHRMLTAVAFANDPVGTRWGNLRAKFGHPKPFGIKFVEIGNENGGPSYHHNYPIMQAALEKAFPSVTPITDDWGGVPRGRLQIIDQHFYPSGKWFRHHANQYDAYPAHGPKVFVGEYAVGRAHNRLGDFHMTLAETAYMIGMERNCSKVIMASYGVTLDNAAAAPAHINLIEFNDRTAIGRSMYWVQYLFNHQQPRIVYPAVIHFNSHRGLRYRLFADAGVTADRRELIIKIDNASNHAITTELKLHGIAHFAGGGIVYTLHERNPRIDNNFLHPARVVPVRSVIKAAGKSLQYRFKPYSITVMRMRLAR